MPNGGEETIMEGFLPEKMSQLDWDCLVVVGSNYIRQHVMGLQVMDSHSFTLSRVMNILELY